MKGLAIAREVAEELNLSLPDDYLGWVMWNETGWPSFFDGDPEPVFRQQLTTALSTTESVE